MAKASSKAEKGLAARVGRLEREVTAMTREAPARSEDIIARQAMRGEKPDFLRVTPGNANFEGPVNERLAALKGRSRSDVASDVARGSSSPLGHGEMGRRRR